MTTESAITIEDVEAEFVGKLLAAEIIQTEINDIFDTAKAIYDTMPKGQQMNAVCHDSRSGTNALVPNFDGAILREVIDASQAFNGVWPEFCYDSDDPEVLRLIDAWTEIIGLSPRAVEAKKQLNSLQGRRPGGFAQHRDIDSREIRGWYVRVDTPRRSVTGWVVGGRGMTVHVLPDPMFAVEGVPAKGFHMERTPNDYLVAKQAVRNEESSRSEDVIEKNPSHHLPVSRFSDISKIGLKKFSRKTASFSLILPPELADERKKWVIDLAHKVVATKSDVDDAMEEYLTWQETSGQARQRRDDLRRATKKASGVKFDNMGYTYDMSNTVIQALIEDLGEEKVRTALTAKMVKDLGGELTATEIALIDVEPPIKGKSRAEIHRHLIVGRWSNLAPRF